MEFRHLRYFLALAEELHYGRAARRLAISQPPLSLNIQQLEASVGAKLFVRNSKEVRLTAAGKAFEPAARALLDSAREAALRARDVDRGLAGQLRLGFVGAMLYRGLPQMLRSFQAEHPAMRLVLRELNSADQLLELAHGQLDVGFVHTARMPAEMSRLLFTSERFVACLPADHADADAASLPVRRLRDAPFVLFARSVSPDYYERVLSICTDAGFRPEICHEVRHWLSVVSLVSQGLGVALVPEALRHAGIGNVRFVPLEEAATQSQSWCVWMAADEGALTRGFIERVRAHAALAG